MLSGSALSCSSWCGGEAECGDKENLVSEKFLLAECKEQGLLQEGKEKTE